MEGVIIGGLYLFSSSEMESKERGKKCLEMFEVKVEMLRKGVIYSYTYCNPLIHHSCKLHTFLKRYLQFHQLHLHSWFYLYRIQGLPDILIQNQPISIFAMTKTNLYAAMKVSSFLWIMQMFALKWSTQAFLSISWNTENY